MVAERLVGLPVGLIERLVEQSVLYELLAVSVELAAVVQALQREPHPPCCSDNMRRSDRSETSVDLLQTRN